MSWFKRDLISEVIQELLDMGFSPKEISKNLLIDKKVIYNVSNYKRKTMKKLEALGSDLKEPPKTNYGISRLLMMMNGLNKLVYDQRFPYKSADEVVSNTYNALGHLGCSPVFSTIPEGEWYESFGIFDILEIRKGKKKYIRQSFEEYNSEEEKSSESQD